MNNEIKEIKKKNFQKKKKPLDWKNNSNAWNKICEARKDLTKVTVNQLLEADFVTGLPDSFLGLDDKKESEIQQ